VLIVVAAAAAMVSKRGELHFEDRRRGGVSIGLRGETDSQTVSDLGSVTGEPPRRLSCCISSSPLSEQRSLRTFDRFAKFGNGRRRVGDQSFLTISSASSRVNARRVSVCSAPCRCSFIRISAALSSSGASKISTTS
jgi:hypothetical protein